MVSLSFVIPVYNEEGRLSQTFAALRAYVPSDGIQLEKIIFVNDGSTDKTESIILHNKSILEKFTGAQLEIISYTPNKGKGHAVKTGMLASDSDYTLFFDADISTPLAEFNKFLVHVKNKVDVIIGTRKNGHSTVIKHQPFYREQLGRAFTFLSNLILGTNVTDFTCGFKAFSKNAKAHIFEIAQINGWGYDSEIIFLAYKFGFTVKEVPVKWSNDERTKVKLYRDAIRSLNELVTIRIQDSLGKYSLTRLLPTS